MSKIRCLECGHTAENWREAVRHRKQADHPDVGEVY